MDNPPESKECIVCHIVKPLEDFYWRSKACGKRRGHCRKCQDQRTVDWGRRNVLRRRKRVNTWCRANPEKRKQYNATQNARPERKAQRLKWQREHPEKMKEYAQRHRNKVGFSIQWRIRNSLANRLRKVLRLTKKSISTMKLVGCSTEELRRHLESLWVTGMTWENWGTYILGEPMTWHIDHIRPCASFDLTDPQQQKACFRYTNLQPLWAIDNIRKQDKIVS